MLGKKRDDLTEVLTGLKEKRIISDGTYRDYVFLIRTAVTWDQMDEIAHDLTEICCPWYRSLSFQ